MAYHFFGGEVEASSTLTIGRLTPKGCHQSPQIARKTREKANDQIDRFCCLRLSRHNVSTGNASCAGSRAGRHDHASRLRMRAVPDTSCWCLRGQNHRSPCAPPLSQVCTMAWRRLRALLLRRDRIRPGEPSRHSSCHLPRQIFAESENAARAPGLRRPCSSSNVPRGSAFDCMHVAAVVQLYACGRSRCIEKSIRLIRF